MRVVALSSVVPNSYLFTMTGMTMMIRHSNYVCLKENICYLITCNMQKLEPIFVAHCIRKKLPTSTCMHNFTPHLMFICYTLEFVTVVEGNGTFYHVSDKSVNSKRVCYITKKNTLF